MKNFTFYEKNGNGVLTIKAKDFDEACEFLTEMVENPMGWRCDDDEGEDF